MMARRQPVMPGWPRLYRPGSGIRARPCGALPTGILVISRPLPVSIT